MSFPLKDALAISMVIISANSGGEGRRNGYSSWSTTEIVYWATGVASRNQSSTSEDKFLAEHRNVKAREHSTEVDFSGVAIRVTIVHQNIIIKLRYMHMLTLNVFFSIH